MITGSDPSLLLASLLTPSDPRQSPGTPKTEDRSPFTSNFSDSPVSRVLAAQNPLLEAARPLLRTLSELPSLAESLSPQVSKDAAGFDDSEPLRELLIHDIQQFQYVCDRANLRREHVVTIRYCLCTALDEAISRLPRTSASLWGANSLLILFHNEASGGEKFFLLLGRMAQSPAEHLSALEVLYHILSLNFQGRYALAPDGLRQLERIHSRLLGILLDYHPPVPPALSPHRQGNTGGRLRIVRAVPVWVSASVLGAVLLGLHFMFSAELAPHERTLRARLETLGAQPVSLPFPIAGLPLERWFSKDELRRFDLTIDANTNQIILPGGAFVSGATLRDGVYPALDVLAKQLQATNWRVDVIGHTDNVTLRTGSVFRDNRHLSEERAKAVVKALTDRGVAADRFSIDGKGDTDPVASNRTEEGRQSNRRVEMRLREPGPPPVPTDRKQELSGRQS